MIDNWYVFLWVCNIECLPDMMSSKVLYFRKECMYQYISVNKPHESQILAHKHFLVHFNLVTNVLFCLCLSFLSLVVLRWLLLLFLSCGFLLTVMWFMLFILMFVSNNDKENDDGDNNDVDELFCSMVDRQKACNLTSSHDQY